MVHLLALAAPACFQWAQSQVLVVEDLDHLVVEPAAVAVVAVPLVQEAPPRRPAAGTQAAAGAWPWPGHCRQT